MVRHIALAIGAILAMTTGLSAGHASTVITTGAYNQNPDEGYATDIVTGFDTGPGNYKFTLDLSIAPFAVYTNDVNSVVTFNAYCNYRDGKGTNYCYGDESTFYHSLDKVTPTKYVGIVKVAAPYTEYTPNDYPVVKTKYYEACCSIQIGILSYNPGTYTVSVGDVPEPATWGLMIIGMGGVGIAMRRRDRAMDDRDYGDRLVV